MDKKDYLNRLKTTELRPSKVQVDEDFKPVILNEVPFDDENERLMEQGNDGMHDLQNSIIHWFTKNPKPSDGEVHEFAKELNVDPHEFEQHIYMILGDILTEGRSKGFTGSYDSKQIEMGIKVEMEHTTIPLIAEKISKDHLAEIPDYYDRLAKMEGEAGVEH